MATKGSIADFGLAEIIQLPAMSNRTARLVLRRGDRKADIYYVDGELCHARLGKASGFPVLVEVLPWSDGEFELEMGVTTEERTIDMELGKALLHATIQGEEQAPESDRANVKSTAGFRSLFGPAWDTATFARLCTFVAEHPLFFYACVILKGGGIRAEYIKPLDDLDESAETYTMLRDIMKNYADVCTTRMVVASSYCKVALQAFGENEVLLAMAKPDTTEYDAGVAIDELVQKLVDPYAL